MTAKPVVDAAAVAVFLSDLHGTAIVDVRPMTGGFWSAAYSYSVEGRELVLRLSDVLEGFALDAVAYNLAGPHMPVPEILATGTAFGTSYAISRRCHGQFLEDAAAPEPALARLLGALRKVRTDPADAVSLSGQGPATWRDWVAGALVDRSEQRTGGWRRTLAGLPDVEAVFVAAERRVTELLDSCPERRDLVHGDLLHRNVLVSPDNSHVTGVFSWKCAARGDFLYDVAWCTFWSPWHPGIAAADPWRLTVTSTDLSSADLVHAAARHHCYELAIGASHLGWYLWTRDHTELERAAARLSELLSRGPMPDP